MDIRRVKMGIRAREASGKSLDDLIGGGIPEGNIVVVTGPNGSGKTIMALQYIVSGAQAGERGVYFCFNQRMEDIVQQAACFDWDIEGLIKAGKIQVRIYNVMNDSPTSVQKDIERTLESFKPMRVAVDSISMYTLFMEMAENLGAMMGYDLENKSLQFDRELLIRLAVLKLFDTLKANRTTALVTSELVCEAAPINIDAITQFMADGVIALCPAACGDEGFGTVQVEEMRLTAHTRKIYQTHMDGQGLKVGSEA